MKKPVILFSVAFVVLVAAVGIAGGFVWQQFTRSPVSSVPQEVIVEVHQGESFSKVSKTLEEKGVIKSSAMFSLFARIKGLKNQMKVGEYLFKTNMLPSEILAILISGKSLAKPFTVSEGLTMFEIAESYEAHGLGSKVEFLKWAMDPTLIQSLLGENRNSLEGYLFPETYMITKYMTTKDLVQAMVKRFLTVYAELQAEKHLPGWNRNQVVTLASIVEKETGAPEERPLISSIFHNRLQKRMKLQTDPTVIYGKALKSGKIEINITKADLLAPNSYNTYTIAGLPPGPISNPGKDALTAALTPATSKYLFFVSQNNGTHIFSEDYAAHQRAVAQFQLNRKAREGHSWRELKEKEVKGKTK